MGRKRGFTIVELAVVVGIFFLVMAALTPFVHIVKERKNKSNCANNLMQISLGLHSYALEHDGAFPAKLGDLYPDYVREEKVFDCPATKTPGTKDNPEYIYNTGLTELSGPREIIAQDAGGNHKKSGKNILRINGSVEWIGGAR